MMVGRRLSPALYGLMALVWVAACFGFGIVACGGGGSSTPAPDDPSDSPVESSQKAITGFSFVSPAATGSIDESEYTIALTVPSGTDVTDLVPTIQHTGESISPASGVSRDFSSQSSYTVTAQDGSTQAYTVTVSVEIDVSGTVYYVSNSGHDDDNNGTSPESTWRTIAKVNATSLEPGDAILFKRGDVWRDGPIRVTSSGTSGAQITYGAYGIGDRPRILGSVKAEGWTEISTNIWQSSATVSLNPWEIGYGNEGPPLFFEETGGATTWGVYRSFNAGLTNLTEEYDWTWNDRCVYVYAPSNPGTRYASMEATQLVRGIMLQDHNYITITGLEIKYYADQGIYDNYYTIQLYGLRVTDCEIAYIGRKDDSAGYGLSVHQSDAYYAHNEIHNCGRRGISLTMYGETAPITQSDVTIEYNHFHHGWHTTSLDGCAAGGHVLEDVVFRYNRVDGDMNVQLGDGVNPNSNHIYCDFEGSGTGRVRNFKFYNNIFTYAHGSSIKIADVSNFEICNNTFYNFNPTLPNWQAHVYTSTSNGSIVVKNNIFYNNALNNQWAAVKLTQGYQDMAEIDYNLYFQSAEGQRFYWVDSGTSYRVDQWDAYTSATGFDTHSPAPADPMFVNPPQDFDLGAGSPALGRGTAVSDISQDFYGNPMNTPPDLGAVQR